jgi:hypothetical protein
MKLGEGLGAGQQLGSMDLVVHGQQRMWQMHNMWHILDTPRLQ